MSKFFDFDAFWEEAKGEEAERPQIKVFGEVITLPAVLPARIMLKALRYHEDQGRTIGERFQEYVADLKLFVGAERVERWLDQGIESARIIEIYTHIINLYTPKAGGDSEGNGETPEQGEKPKNRARSSNPGT